MARTFVGRSSEELYNSELHDLFEIIKHIAAEPSDVSLGPLTNRNGAIWLDRTNGGDLKFKNDGDWELVFQDKFKMICDILSPEEPMHPVSGQLWLKNGILMYFSGSEWIPVKSVNVDTEFNLSAFEQFLIIHPVEAAGKLVVDETNSVVSQIKKLYREETFIVRDIVRDYILEEGTFYPDTNSVNVYIQGRKLAKEFFSEVNDNTIRISIDSYTTLLDIKEQEIVYVLIEYVNKQAYDGIGTIDKVILQPSDTHTQFLLPNVEVDRFFIDGMYTDDYREISNVAIEYPTANLQGKMASAIHVDPKKLTGIKKRLFLIDKANPIIPIQEKNTEYYGVKSGIGKLLLKSKIDTDYTSVAQGIRLSEAAASTYDFVQTITYEFKNVKGTGNMKKNKLSLSDTTSIFVGEVADPLCVFVQGFYLDENPNNYTYDNGYIKLAIETKMDVGVIAFPKKEIGTIAAIKDNIYGIVHLSKTYNRLLVFVYGELVEASLTDYVVDENNPSIIYIPNAKIGMKYAIVETETLDPAEEMFYKAGRMKRDPYTDEVFIELEENELSDEENIVLFVNGLLMKKKDIFIDTANNRIDIYGGFKEGLDYVLLKDPSNRFIFSDYVSFNTIPLGHKSDATLVYVENQLATDARSVYSSQLPSKGNIGEIKQLLTNDSSNWYFYHAINGWEVISDIILIDKLNAMAANYISDDYTINILQNFGRKDCTYYSYQYANSVEQPLLRGVIKTLESKSEYRTAFNHVFKSNKNSLAIWQNGLRQYPDTTGNQENINGYFELGNSRFKVPNPIDGVMFYIIEQPENNESKICENQILTFKDIVPGTNNIFKTNIPLWPGNVRVFVSGLRQPENAFKVIDNNLIMIKEDILAYTNNFPKEAVQLEDGNFVDIERVHPDAILIEVRQDHTLKEITLPVRYPGQKEWSIEKRDVDATKGGDGLPESILLSKDFIMIYVNGMAYGKDYRVDLEQGKIILNNQAITSTLGKDPVYDYFKENPSEYEKWRIQNGGIEYTPKKNNDTITFEWR